MSVAANKVCGVRAALAHDEVTARRAREHNHCNALCLGTDLLSEDQIRNIVEIFLTTAFAEGRHARRVAKLRLLEEEERSAGRAPQAVLAAEAATPPGAVQQGPH
jgi:ribose 5-phosphate isomerase B